MYQFEPFCTQVRRHHRQSRDIAPRMRETCDHPRTNRIAAGGKHDWNFLCSALGGEGCGRSRGDNQVDLVLDQLRCKIRKALKWPSAYTYSVWTVRPSM